VGLGLAILWAITSWINNKNTTVGDVVLAMLLVLPILIYALISGRLTELKGPGGVEAKFTGVATRPVAETASHDLVSFDQLLTVGTDEGGEQPRGEQQLAERVRRFTEVQPIVMVITIGSGGKRKTSDIEALKMYVAQLARTRNFALVAFLDTKKDFVAYMPSWTIQNRLLDEHKANDLFRVIQEDDRETLIDYPGVVRDTISPTTTNDEALRKMVTSNLNVIVVVDENNRLKGVVEREQVLTRMMLALTPNG
jgi:CBS domain-containing protein